MLFHLRPAATLKMKVLAILVAFSLLGICLTSPASKRGALSSCEPSEEHGCCFPPGQVSIDNCDCDVGALCEIYCNEMDFPNSSYWPGEVCCCDN